MVFQCSKVLNIDDDTYPIISCYRDFNLERHETYPHSSELVSESIQMKLCQFFFFLDIFFMMGLNLLSRTRSKTQIGEKESVVFLPLSSKKAPHGEQRQRKRKKLHLD
jgi:hypothetical protein